MKRPPTAVAGDDLVVAPGEMVAFDGARSLAGERPIARYLWDIGDGELGEGREASHAFAQPGRYIVTLSVEDDTPPPCNCRSMRRSCRSMRRRWRSRATTGDSRSARRSGWKPAAATTSTARWSSTVGLRRRHHARRAVRPPCLRRPGTYRVVLTVRDDAGVANSVGRDELRGRGQRAAGRRGRRRPPGRGRRGDRVRCFRLDRSRRRAGRSIAGTSATAPRAMAQVTICLPHAGHLPGRADRARQFGHPHEHRFGSADRRGQRAAGRRCRGGSGGDLQRGPFRRRRLPRSGWRDRALRLGVRRRRQRRPGRRRSMSTARSASIPSG